MKPSSGAISIAASAPKIEVDNRISLRYYYRIADTLIKQADIYRGEKNIIDLYVMLLRFSSLITETIPSHQDYQVSLQSEKLFFRKKLFNVLSELEALKPDVQQRIEELNWKSRNQVNRWGQAHQNSFIDNSLEWPYTRKQTAINEYKLSHQILGQNGFPMVPVDRRDRLPQSKSTEEQLRKL